MGFTRPRITALLVFAWTSAVVAVYYKRIWQLFLLGPKDWIIDNPSLADLYHSLQVIKDSGSAGWNPYNIQDALGAGLSTLIRCEFENWIERFVYRAGTGFGMLSYISLRMAAMAIIQPEIISEWYVKAYEDARFILYRLVQE
jgi:hypothetical protein